MKIPPPLVSFLFLNVQAHNTTPAAIATIQSITKLLANVTGIINAEIPTTKIILKMLLPTIFPIAISAFPFIAAITEVNNSGRDVPIDTIVNPITISGI